MNTNTAADSRRILLATVGGTAQVITETLYAINKDGLPWPDEIRVITTTTGAEKVRKGLLIDGHLNRLCQELGRDRPAFDEAQILIIPDANGLPVDDARSLADHEALGDFIMTQVRDITANEKTKLHASLAGGRKTMTFYLGYAMSLFGRREDILSHVLVSESFENLPDFWYPSQLQGDLKKTTRTGEILETLKSADAQVTLAQIPFIRLHQDLPRAIEVGKTIKLTDLIQRMNMGSSPDSIRMCIDLPNSQLVIWSAETGDKSQVRIFPNKLELAFYVMCYRCSINNIPVRRPGKGKLNSELLKIFPNELLDLCGLPREEKWADALDALEAWGELYEPDLQRSIVKINERMKDDIGISCSWFDSRLNTLKELLKDQLPKTLVEKILPSPTGKGGHYTIKLPLSNITLVESKRV